MIDAEGPASHRAVPSATDTPRTQSGLELKVGMIAEAADNRRMGQRTRPDTSERNGARSKHLPPGTNTRIRALWSWAGTHINFAVPTLNMKLDGSVVKHLTTIFSSVECPPASLIRERHFEDGSVCAHFPSPSSPALRLSLPGPVYPACRTYGRTYRLSRRSNHFFLK
jgi:hypothetical protein